MIQAETTCYDHAERWSNCTRRTAEVRFHLDCTRVVRLRGRHGGSDAQPPDGPSAETRRAAHGCGGRPAWWGHGGGSRGSRWRRCGVRLVPAPPRRSRSASSEQSRWCLVAAVRRTAATPRGTIVRSESLQSAQSWRLCTVLRTSTRWRAPGGLSSVDWCSYGSRAWSLM
jgi:hypothetical protein